MGITYICDCCQKPCEKPTEKGYVKKCYYCAGCLPSVEEYYQSMDDLHTKMAAAWKKTLKELREAWEKTFPGGKLPDE